MKVLKFGGSSLANAQRFLAVSNIITQAQRSDTVAVVLSAPAGVTNLLVNLSQNEPSLQSNAENFTAIANICTPIIQGLQQALPAFDANAAHRLLQQKLAEIQTYVNQIPTGEIAPPHLKALIDAQGEMLSIAIMQAVLRAKNHQVHTVDPMSILLANDDYLNATVDINASQNLCKNSSLPNEGILLMAGFSAGNAQGERVLLGRNGSDYSAACLSVCLNADVCEIWTDVDGVYTCDPRIVPNAKLLPQLSYFEAMELSYFGASVLHPRTISPLIDTGIPCVIKNTHNPEAKGSLIAHNAEEKGQVKGITFLDNLTLFSVSGSAMQGQVGMAARLFSTLSQAGVSMILITQSSSEYSISFCVSATDATRATHALEQQFAKELASGALDPLNVRHGLAIVSVVGDGMVNAKGVAAKFFTALAQASISIIAIAQGASERSISAVIPQQRAVEALRTLHHMLFDHKKVLNVFLLGVGGVGQALIEQIATQQAFLHNKGIELNVWGMANSRQMVLNADGLDMHHWRTLLANSNQPFNLDTVVAFCHEHHLVNPVFVDCTSSDDIAWQYADILAAGIAVVTPNKKANTQSMAYYHLLRENSRLAQSKFLYDTNVGAGLPVIENLQNLLAAGDELIQFNGILSGSLSFIFGKLDEGLSLSQATLLAKEKGFTEPDPRDDLSGNDVARKLLILARESGLELEFDDIHIESVLPKGFAEGCSTAEFLERLPSLDDSFQQKVAQAKANGNVLRYVGQIKNGQCQVAIQAVAENEPLFKVKDGENALAFYTKFYQPIPLLLRGYGAGNAVTAAGVFADILRTIQP